MAKSKMPDVAIVVLEEWQRLTSGDQPITVPVWWQNFMTQEEGQKIEWTQANSLWFEPNGTYIKYKETAHMLCSNNPISLPSLEISLTVWFPLRGKELKCDLG